MHDNEKELLEIASLIIDGLTETAAIKRVALSMPQTVAFDSLVRRLRRHYREGAASYATAVHQRRGEIEHRRLADLRGERLRAISPRLARLAAAVPEVDALLTDDRLTLWERHPGTRDGFLRAIFKQYE